MAFRPHFEALPLKQIRLTDEFWQGWQNVLRTSTIPSIYKKLEETGRLKNFEDAAKGEGNPTGYYFNDSDVYKWCEAAAYALALGEDQVISSQLDHTIALIAGAQEESGYINTFMQLNHPELKLRNLVAMHEMYCVGHLVEAGVALFDELGDRRLLDIGIRAVDHLMSIFGPDKKPGCCGHEEIELALLRLAKSTGDLKYREVACWMIEQRGQRPSFFQSELEDEEAQKISPWMKKMLSKNGEYSGEYAQDHLPIRQHTEVVGHAVRAMYLYIAATQLAEGDEELSDAIERTWHNLVSKRMYVTGGVGPSGDNEGFTYDYDLPNLSAYAETCAACGLVFWGQRLLEMTGNSAYADVMERALYNGAISGISEQGDHFFYANPLESRGHDQRLPWFECACCPPNIARLIGSAAKYVAGVSEEAFWIHIPAGFKADLTIGGVPVKIVCESNYPWSGRASIRVETAKPVQFDLRLRIPEWADEIETELPGLEEGAEYDQGYAVFAKEWKSGDTLTIDLGMSPKWVEADPRVIDNLGRVCLTSGPLVYCAESADNKFPPQSFSVDLDAPVEVGSSENQLKIAGFREVGDLGDELYAAIDSIAVEEAELQMVPYHQWNNRGAGFMQVWLRRA